MYGLTGLCITEVFTIMKKNALLLFVSFFMLKKTIFIEKISCFPNILSYLLKNAKMQEKTAV